MPEIPIQRMQIRLLLSYVLLQIGMRRIELRIQMRRMEIQIGMIEFESGILAGEDLVEVDRSKGERIVLIIF